MRAKHCSWGFLTRVAFTALALAANGCALARSAAPPVARSTAIPGGLAAAPIHAVAPGELAPGELAPGEPEETGGYHDFIAVHTYEAATEPAVRIRCAW